MCLKCKEMFPCHTKYSDLVTVSQEPLWTKLPVSSHYRLTLP